LREFEAAVGVTTGVSAHDRLQTVRSAIADKAKPSDLCRPRHVFPLRARPGGVLERPGHTEAIVDLMCLAGLKPYGVLCELMNPDGTMAKGQQVVAFLAKKRYSDGLCPRVGGLSKKTAKLRKR
jgi:3,4-dihydroxy 2-butanone 4-phosphate synthase